MTPQCLGVHFLLRCHCIKCINKAIWFIELWITKQVNKPHAGGLLVVAESSIKRFCGTFHTVRSNTTTSGVKSSALSISPTRTSAGGDGGGVNSWPSPIISSHMMPDSQGKLGSRSVSIASSERDLWCVGSIGGEENLSLPIGASTFLSRLFVTSYRHLHNSPTVFFQNWMFLWVVMMWDKISFKEMNTTYISTCGPSASIWNNTK